MNLEETAILFGLAAGVWGLKLRHSNSGSLGLPGLRYIGNLSFGNRPVATKGQI